MAPDSVFVDVLVMYLIAIILRIFREKSWFGFATNYQKNCVRKPISANLETQIFKNLSPLQTAVVPPGELIKENYLLPFLSSLGPPSLKVGTAAL